MSRRRCLRRGLLYSCGISGSLLRHKGARSARSLFPDRGSLGSVLRSFVRLPELLACNALYSSTSPSSDPEFSATAVAAGSGFTFAGGFTLAGGESDVSVLGRF